MLIFCNKKAKLVGRGQILDYKQKEDFIENDKGRNF